MTLTNFVGETYQLKRHTGDPKERVRPKSSQIDQINHAKKFGKLTKLKFDASPPGIEWLAQNWRR